MSKTRIKSKSKDNGAGTSVAVSVPGTAVALPAGVTIKRRITLPSLAIKKAGESRILAFADAMRESKVVTKQADGTERKPAMIATVGDCLTGEMFIFIVPTVVHANLARDYPATADGVPGYVGKAFQIVNKGKRSDSQRYNDFEISEVEVNKEVLEAQRATLASGAGQAAE